MNIPIGKVEDAKFYIDLAFKRANRESKKKLLTDKTKFNRIKTLELIKLNYINGSLAAQLDKITKAFPSFNQLSEFYRELVKCFVDYGELKKSLGAVNWAKQRISVLHHEYSYKIKKCQEIVKLKQLKSAFYGRVSSTMKQINPELSFLEEMRRILKEFPIVKQMFTACITGFPNVGKTTLLSKITASTPEIAAYPFTTKQLFIGYFNDVQVIDTPGTLNRFEKMNNIEKQAHLAMKHVADLIVYVFDLTEPYPLADQKKLLVETRKLDKPVIVYVSKSDIVPKDTIEEFAKKYKGIYDLKELKEKILQAKKNKENFPR